MPYFPFFIDISKQKCLIVGGGRVALHKLKKLLPFSPEIYVTAENILPEIEKIEELHLSKRRFFDSDLNGMDFVVAATNEHEINTYISQQCRLRKIPCNAADDPENCTFFFPALAQSGDITIGISTSGKSPLLASHLRQEAEKLVTQKESKICELMGFVRPYVMSKFSENKRAEIMAMILEYCYEALPEKEELIAYTDSLEI